MNNATLNEQFCISCGILLSLDLVGKTKRCRACTSHTSGKNDRSNSHISEVQVCHCDYCKSSPVKPQGKNISFKEKSSRHPPPRSKAKHQRKGERPQKQLQGHQGTDYSVSENVIDSGLGKHQDSSNTDWAPAFNDDWMHNESRMNVSDNWYEDSNMQWDIKEPDNFEIENDNYNDWTVVKKKSSSTGNEMFGDHEFPPVQQSNNTESGVLHDLKQEWEREQEEYKQKLVQTDNPEIKRMVSGHRRKSNRRKFLIGGVDISFIKEDAVNACACLSIVSFPDLKLVYQTMEMVRLTQPYFPGFLAFREIPPLMKLFEKVDRDYPQYRPDVIMVDGNGILHPRGCGLASQLGVMLNKPTLGVAKSLISAQGILYDEAHKMKIKELAEAGDGFDLVSEETGKILGKCLRVHDKAPNPVYVSVGHKISLSSAVWLTLECCKYRVPEPVRMADLNSREYISQGKTEPSVFAA